MSITSKNSLLGVLSIRTLVRERGLEPPHLAVLSPQNSVSAISPLAHDFVKSPYYQIIVGV